MADSTPRYWNQTQHQTDTSALDQQSIEQLSQWVWDLNSPPLSPRDASSPADDIQYPGYISFDSDGLYGFTAETICRPARLEVPLLTTASERSLPSADTGRDVSHTAEVTRERAEILAMAKATISNPDELAKFKDDMKTFEQRAATQEPPLPAEEIVKTYQQIGRLLEAVENPQSPLTSAHHVHLAEQVMEQAAKPDSIDQGWHNTCTLTTIEARAYTRSPSEAARLVADVATTGKYTTSDGQAVEIPRSSLAPADSEAKAHPNVDGERSYASQLFQVTAVNLYWSQHEYEYTDANGNRKTVPAGKLKYEQVEPDPGNPDDTGERLVDYSVKRPAVVMDHWANPPVPVCEPQADLHDDGAIKWMSDKITGNDDTIYIFHDGYENADGKGALLFDSQQELEEQIRAAQESNALPIIMAVHTSKQPFWSDSGGNAAGGSGGWHVITITGYDARTQVVTIDNQWGSDVDHQGTDGIRLGALYRASIP